MEIKAELTYPYTEEQRVEFIVQQNHNLGYEIRYVEREIESEKTVFEFEDIEEEQNIYDEEGNITSTETVIVQKPIMITVEGEEIQKSHIETVNETVTDLQAWGYTQEEILSTKKEAKFNENTSKAQQAIQDGYVVFKEAQFETNTQTCSDLTSTMLLMQAGGIESYDWLSKDDKVVTLTLEDFGILGGLIATYKNVVWNVKYLDFKQQIEEATTIEELDAIIIDYNVPSILELIENNSIDEE